MNLIGKLAEKLDTLGDSIYTYRVTIGGHACVHVAFYVTSEGAITYVNGIDPLTGPAKVAFMDAFVSRFITNRDMGTVDAYVP